MAQQLEVTNYIVNSNEMVSMIGPFRQFLCKVFNIQERKGSIYTITLKLKYVPFVLIETSSVRDSYNTNWTVQSVDLRKNNITIKNLEPIYGLNRKNMNTLQIL